MSQQEDRERPWRRRLGPPQSRGTTPRAERTRHPGPHTPPGPAAAVRAQQGATELKHLPTPSGDGNQWSVRRHKDTTAEPRATGPCSLCSTTLMIPRGLFDFILACVSFLDSAMMFSVSVLISPPRKRHGKPPTRRVSTSETLIFRTCNSAIPTQD